MDESGRSVDGALDAKAVLSQKVCFICHTTSKEIDDDTGYYKNGYYVYLVDLSKLGDGSSSSSNGDLKLKPNFILQFDIGMSFCALGSTLYATDMFYTVGVSPAEAPFPKVYYLDIQTLNQNQFELCDADFCTLPSMCGNKLWPLMAAIPGTRKFLVFSSLFEVYDYFPRYAHYDDFEMYDGETNSWEKLPQFEIRSNTSFSYFLHLSREDKRGTEIISPMERNFTRCTIYRYTFINGGAAFLVQLSCGVKLALDLNSSCKSWQFYHEDKVNTSIPYRYPLRVHRGDGIFDNIAFPQSSFGKDDPVKHEYFMATPLDGDNHVCIVQTAISRGSKHGRVIMDVVSRVANNLLASCRFVVEGKWRSIAPFCMFVYNPKCP